MNCRSNFLIALVLLFACGVTVLYNCGWFKVPPDKKPEMLSYWAAMEPISKGEWKPGLRYKSDLQCGNMTTRTEARKLHFVFKNKDLNSANVLHSFQNKIIGKNVTIFGDSLQLGFFNHIVEILKICGRIIIGPIEHKPYRYRLHTCSSASKMNGINLRLVYFYQYDSFLCESVNTNKKVISRKMIVKEIQNSDIIILNLGLHYGACNVSIHKRTLEKLAYILKTELSKHPEKQVVFRNTLPQHFYRGKGRDRYFHGFNKSKKCFGTNNVQHWTNKHLKEVSKEYGFKYLESFPIYADRWDLHITRTGRLDCTHFCYTPELIVPEIALLNTLITA